MSLEDKTARSLGVNVNLIRILVSLVAVLLASISTAVVGAVSFLGLIAVSYTHLLDLKQRELITFCFLAAQGGCESQLTSHAIGNMNLGNDKEFLVRVVSQILPYIGYPRSLNANRCIENAATQMA